ncbi:MAG: fused MFS/spermidine synthase, partial [bacterium]
IYLNILVSCFLFLPSAIILGIIQPALLKIYSQDFSTLGKHYGTLSTVWSVGSILGVFLTGFFFTSYLGSSNTLFLVSLILLINGLFYIKYLSIKNSASLFLVCLLAIIFLYFYNSSIAQSKNVIFQKETAYYSSKIISTTYNKVPVKFLFLDTDAHSIEATSGNIHFSYTSLCPILSLVKQNISSMYYIGGGSYSMPKYCQSLLPKTEIIVSEIDPEVKKIAEDYFDLKKYPIETEIGDARINLSKSTKQYDFIFGDAYNSFIAVPWHLMTYEFNELVKTKLTSDGVYAINFIGTTEGPGTDILYSVIKTISKSFFISDIFAFGSKPAEIQNIVIFGKKTATPNDSDLTTKLVENDLTIKKYLLPKERVDQLIKDSENSTLLTDDFAPTEDLLSRAIRSYWHQNRNYLKTISF